MSKKTLALIISLLVLTVLLLYIALRSEPAGQSQQATDNIQPTPTSEIAHSILSLTPDPVDLTASSTGTVDVIIDTGDNQVTAVQLEMAFDPAVISNVRVTPADFFASPVALINTIDQQTGRVSYALGITPAEFPRSGIGKVATITFTKRASPSAQITETELTLLPKSLVSAQGITASVLKEATGTTVILRNQTVTPTNNQILPSQ